MGRQSGQSVIGIFLGLSILFGSGVAALQIAGLALRSWQVQEAATAGATTLAHGVRIGDPTREPCWEAPDGLWRPAAYSVAITYRDPVTSPLLGVLLGSTYTSTSEATVVGE